MSTYENRISVKGFVKFFQMLFSGDQAQRQRLRLEMARICAGFFGDYYLGDDNKLWRQDKDFLSKHPRLSPRHPFSEERKFTLREFVRHTDGLKGDMAECGSYTGASAYFMAEAAPQTPMFLFDSFEGLSLPGAEDSAENGIRYWKAGDMCSPEEILHQNLAEFDNIHVMKGWIPERFPEVSNHLFRLVHIDVDLYEPTLESLRFFYPRLEAGGVIVLDDYGFTTCPGAYKATNKFMSDKPEYVLHLPTGQGVIIRSSAPVES